MQQVLQNPQYEVEDNWLTSKSAQGQHRVQGQAVNRNCWDVQAAAERVQMATREAGAARAAEEACTAETAMARRRMAELEGALSVSQEIQANNPPPMLACTCRYNGPSLLQHPASALQK